MKYEYHLEVRYGGVKRSASKDRIIRSVAKPFRGRVKYKGAFHWRFGIKKGKGWIAHEVDFYTEREAGRFKSEIKKRKGFSTSSIMG